MRHESSRCSSDMRTGRRCLGDKSFCIAASAATRLRRAAARRSCESTKECVDRCSHTVWVMALIRNRILKFDQLYRTVHGVTEINWASLRTSGWTATHQEVTEHGANDRIVQYIPGVAGGRVCEALVTGLECTMWNRLVGM